MIQFNVIVFLITQVMNKFASWVGSFNSYCVFVKRRKVKLNAKNILKNYKKVYTLTIKWVI